MTKHEAALRALEELESRARTGIWSAGKPGTNVSNWQLATIVRDALTAQGEAPTSVHVVMREGPFPIKAIHDSRAGAEADAAMRGQDYEVETWRIQRGDPAPSAPPVPYTTPCFECGGFTRRYVDGARESDKCSWCHGGGVVPSAPPARCPNCGEPGDERYWKGHFHEGEWLCPRTPVHSADTEVR